MENLDVMSEVYTQSLSPHVSQAASLSSFSARTGSMNVSVDVADQSWVRNNSTGVQTLVDLKHMQGRDIIFRKLIYYLYGALGMHDTSQANKKTLLALKSLQAKSN